MERSSDYKALQMAKHMQPTHEQNEKGSLFVSDSDSIIMELTLKLTHCFQLFN